MLVKVGLFLLLAWLLGSWGLYRLGVVSDLLLLAGLMILLLAVLKARDTTQAGRPGSWSR